MTSRTDSRTEYAARYKAIRAELAEIGRLLTEHDRRAYQAYETGVAIWDHAGDLGHVQELTAQIGAFLSDGEDA